MKKLMRIENPYIQDIRIENPNGRGRCLDCARHDGHFIHSTDAPCITVEMT